MKKVHGYLITLIIGKILITDYFTYHYEEGKFNKLILKNIHVNKICRILLISIRILKYQNNWIGGKELNVWTFVILVELCSWALSNFRWFEIHYDSFSSRWSRCLYRRAWLCYKHQGTRLFHDQCRSFAFLANQTSFSWNTTHLYNLLLHQILLSSKR